MLQDLLLGMNAHILHDLPISLDKVGIAPGERALRRRDHERINEILSGMIDEVQRELAQHYSMVLGFLDRLFGPKDELLTDAGIRVARANAWQMALELSDAPDETSRVAIRRRLDESTLTVSRPLVPGWGWLRRIVPPFRLWDRALATRKLAVKETGSGDAKKT